MNNYYYIVAGLPVLGKEWKPGEKSPEELRSEIKESCSGKDSALISVLESGFDEDNLDPDFYRMAVSHKNRFIREYFRFDLDVRNAKVRFLNKALGRAAELDTVALGDSSPAWEFEEESALESVLGSKDILERERGIDDMMWKKIDELTVFDYFDIEAVLGFLAKLRIVERWYRLDSSSGREMFRKLVDEVRGTFKGVEYSPDIEQPVI